MKKNVKLIAILIILLVPFVFTACDGNAAEEFFYDNNNVEPAQLPKYTVSFDKNGGTGFMASVQVKPGASYTISDCTFAAPSSGALPTYTVGNTARYFAGWNTSADGSGRWYKKDDVLPAGNGDITLYAMWGYGFSVGYNKWVYFSHGNLYWDGSEYQFEANQCDYRNYDAGIVGSFWWSKNASVARAETYSDSDVNATDVLFTNATQTTPDANFTVNGVTGKFRTLSKDEWKFILGTNGIKGTEYRNVDKRFAKANVNGVNGLLIFPDVFEWSTSMGTEPDYNVKDAAFSANIYTSDNLHAMETAGVVFLPAAGYRYGSSISEEGIFGYYWSSTPDDSDNTYYMCFDDYGVSQSSCSSRFYGRSVRLVCEN